MYLYDEAGNQGSVNDAYGSHQYYFFLTDEVPTPATITPAVTVEDRLTPVMRADVDAAAGTSADSPHS